MLSVSEQVSQDLIYAGTSIRRFIDENSIADIQYILIVEGQSSRDQYSQNYELSYQRALELKKFWERNNIHFGPKCEVLVSGSGDGRLSGTDFMRESDEKANQRFLIHIIPKYGTMAK